MPLFLKKKEAPTSRTFHVPSAEAGHHRHHHDGLAYCDNSVSTCKYTVLSFFPKSLFEQFRRLANVYFLVIIVLLMIGTYTTFFQAPLTPYTTLFPLIVVLAVTMGKEGFEDVKRHIADRETNSAPAEELSLEKPREFDKMQRQQIRVSRIVRVLNKHEVPADMILLTSSEPGGNCYIETSNIDGETNLKIKQAAQTATDGIGSMWKAADPAELFGWRGAVECELPNSQIHNFNGVLRHEGEGNRETPVDQGNLLLRGSSVRNTKWVLGLVVYTGKDTKLVQNSREAPSKLSTVEVTVNNMLYLILTAQLVLASVSVFCYMVWNKVRRSKLDYTCLEAANSENDFYAENCGTAAEPSTLGMWFTFFTLFNNFVPISLYVTMEMVNYCQAFFIDNDLEMYDPEADMPAMARTSNMNGDLASIQYVFSDKTGTLTRNIMEFRRCSVAGQVYGNMDTGEEVPADKFIIEGQPLTALASEAIAKGPGSAAYYFMLVLSVCHTVVIETLENGTTAYQAESPDEEALVSAAADLSFRFKGRGPGEVNIEVDGKELTYKVLCTIAFTSTRKRMSVIVKTPEGKVLLMTKGADNIVGGRAKEYQSTDKTTVDFHLRLFSEDGLRTLMLAIRELPSSEFDTWFAGYQKAAASIKDRAEAIADAAEKIEKDLVVVGTTAIEDELQEGVPDTIADLLDGGIKVWVLTGDKMETAINIGYSCRLLGSRMALLKLKDTGDPATIRRHLKKLLNAFDWLVEQERKLGDTLGRRIMERMTQCTRKGPMGFRSSWQAGEEDIKIMEDPDLKVCYQPQNDAPHFKQLTSDTVALVVDGPALVHIFGDPEYEAMFLRLTSVCRSVVACRVSPAQKRMIVRLVKSGIKPKPITLSIGDGANDVAMIQEAQIGVGISGKEGKQAVNSADFAIAQFRFLKRLLLIHGRYDYRRMSKVILYSFYKNIVLTFILFYYLFFTGFSGQSLFSDLVYSAFNFLCAMPIICVGFFDTDILPEHVMAWKWVYMSGRDHMDLNVRLMAQWFVRAVVDSILLFCFSLYAAQYSRGVWGWDGDSADIYVFGTTVYSMMLLAMSFKVATITYTWNRISWFFFLGSLLLYLIFIFSYAAMPASYSFYNVAVHMLRLAPHWLLVVLGASVSVGIDYAVIYVKLAFFPTPVDVAVEKSNILAHSKPSSRPSATSASASAAALNTTAASASASGRPKVAPALPNTENGGGVEDAAAAGGGGPMVVPAVVVDGHRDGEEGMHAVAMNV